MSIDALSAVYDPYDPATVAYPYDAYERLREAHPVYHNPQRGFWAISRFADVVSTLHDHQRFSNSEGILLDRDLQPPVPMLTNLDPPRHQQLRALVSRSFTPMRVHNLEDKIRTLARSCLDQAGSGETVDLVELLAAPLPTTIIAELLGIPATDRDQFRRWADEINAGNPDDPEVGNQVLVSVLDLSAYLYDVLMERRDAPGDDMISHLVSSVVDDEDLSDEEIIGFCFLLLVAGSETIAGLIGTTALNLHVHADQRDILAAQPGLVGAAVEEFLRFGGSVQGLTRTTTTDVELHGEMIPEGAIVLVLYAAANRDDREFERASSFDVTREIKRHVGLGHGLHHCLGAALARLEARVVIEELLARSPRYELDVDAVRWHQSPTTRGPAHLAVRL